METFSALLAICAGNSPVSGAFPAQRPVTRSFDIFFDLRLNKRLSEQSWGWWFETPSCPLWHQCNFIFRVDFDMNWYSYFSLKYNLFGDILQFILVYLFTQSRYSVIPQFAESVAIINLSVRLITLLHEGTLLCILHDVTIWRWLPR